MGALDVADVGGAAVGLKPQQFLEVDRLALGLDSAALRISCDCAKQLSCRPNYGDSVGLSP